MSIEWTPELATGIGIVDEQHRALYRTVAKLHEIMKTGALGDLAEVLAGVERYASVHFRTEELEMRRAGYPGLRWHRIAHAGFAAQYRTRVLAMGARPRPSAVVELSTWLGAWLRDHVRVVDGEMARFLREARAGEPPARGRRGRAEKGEAGTNR